MKFLEKFDSKAYFNVYIYQDDYTLDVSEDELDMLIKIGFDIYWSDADDDYINPGYRYNGKVTDLLQYLSEYNSVSNGISPDDFAKIKKYNI